VVVACLMRRHHRCKGKVGLQLHKMDTKWSLKVPIAFSAALFRCRLGGDELPLDVACSKKLFNQLWALVVEDLYFWL
jgi:hypothetical protein